MCMTGLASRTNVVSVTATYVESTNLTHVRMCYFEHCSTIAV